MVVRYFHVRTTRFVFALLLPVLRGPIPSRITPPVIEASVPLLNSFGVATCRTDAGAVELCIRIDEKRAEDEAPKI